MRLRHYTINKFYCTNCGTEGIPIARKSSRQREYHHLKKLYCVKCKSEHNHVEIRPFDDYDYEQFYQDFINGEFKEESYAEKV